MVLVCSYIANMYSLADKVIHVVFFFCFSDLYINVSLFSGEKQLQSHRTSKKKGSTDVLFYENYALDLSSLELRQLTLRLTAMHCCKYVINADHVIGHVDTRDSSGESSFGAQWVEVITCPGQTINRWHTLWC